jgi:hemoglobin/transferrin/lactoferrin receptor protein
VLISVKHIRFACLPAVLAISPAAHAQLAAIDPIVVTAVASRIAESVEDTPATLSVITRQDLDRQLANTLRDAIRYEPGVSIENGATRFGFGGIAIRGLEGNRVQILYDGIRMPDQYKVGSFSNANRNLLDLGLLSRMEILRGPASALYGSDALAGVVSFTSVDPRDLLGKGDDFAARIDAGYASANSSAPFGAVVAGRAEGIELLAGAHYTDSSETINRGEVDTIGATRTVPNPQSGHATSALAKIVVPTQSAGQFRLAYDNFSRSVATDVASLNPQSAKTVSLNGNDGATRQRVSLDHEIAGALGLDRLTWLLYGQRATTTQDTTEVRANTTATCLSAPGTVRCRRDVRFEFDQDEYGFLVIGQRAFGANQRVMAGIEGARTQTEEIRDGRVTNLVTGDSSNIVGTDIFPTRDFPNAVTKRLGIFAQDEIALGWGTLIPALRYDRFRMTPQPDSLYETSNPGRTTVGSDDSAWSPKLGALVPVGAGTTLTFQAASGFRAPPYSDVNIGLSNLPLGYAVIANPDLQPETSWGIEAGVRGRGESWSYMLTAYRTDYNDLIVSRAPLPCPGDPRCVPGAPITFQSQNVTRARIEGIEARGQYAFDREWSLQAAYAYTRGDDLSKDVPLNTIDPPKLVVGLDWEAPAKAGGGALHVTHVWAQSRIDRSATPLFATPAFTVVDLTAYWNATRDVSLYAGIFNIGNEKYWLWSDVRSINASQGGIDRYTQAGRNYSVQITARF